MASDINVIVYQANRRIEKYGFDHQLEKLQEAIVKTKNPKYIYTFAKAVKGANIEKLTDAIISTNSAEYIYRFALYVEGANIEKLQDAIIKSNIPQCTYQFAEQVKGADIERLSECDLLPEHIIKFVSLGVPVEKMQQKLIGCRQFDIIVKFARLKGSNIKFLEDIIIKNKDPNGLLYFAAVEGANIQRLEEEIIKSKNCDAIINFAGAFYFRGANVKKLEEAIIKLGNPKKIELFAYIVPTADLAKLRNAIKSTGDEETLKMFDSRLPIKETYDISFLNRDL